MAWQALACLMPLPLDRQTDSLAHLLVHAEALDHHHHQDQSLHVDDDGSEPPHQHAQPALQLPGLLPSMTLAAGERLPAVLVPGAPAGHPPVFLEGLLRPPRPAAPMA